ncbi:MAG: hypothetical protein V1896_02880 [Candidatus Zambryskibacteria bacterium]
MNNITNFLQKFLNLEKDNNAKLAIILDVTKQTTGLTLSREMLEIKGDNLKINCNPCQRSEIFMHCSKIEESLKQQKIFLKIV